MSKSGSFDRFFQVLILAGLGAFELYFFSFLLKADEIDLLLVIIFAVIGFITIVTGLTGIVHEANGIVEK